MAFNGSGTFNLIAGNPVVTGTTISSTWANNTLSDIATGLSTTITKDGQTTPTANIPMGGFKFTGLGAGTATGNSLRWEQLFSQGAPVSVASAGTTDIGAQTSVAVEISGTTTITSFGTNYNGPRYLRFTGSLLLTHNATTLNLPNGANITTVAGDTAMAYPNSAGNGWNVVFYQRGSAAQIYGQCRLTLSAGSLKLLPFNGNLLTVNGNPCAVPDAGVTLAATGLSATTLYYIYAVATAGVITSLEASTTGHSTDTAAGNKGVEIKTGDSTRSLVGMAYVKTAATFADSTSQRFTRSWFNETGIATGVVLSANTNQANTSYAEPSSSIRNEIAVWSGEAVFCYLSGTVSSNGLGNTVNTAIGIDATNNGEFGANRCYQPAANVGMPMSCSVVRFSLSEGFHFITMVGLTDAGTATWSGSPNAHGCFLSVQTKR